MATQKRGSHSVKSWESCGLVPRLYIACTIYLGFISLAQASPGFYHLQYPGLPRLLSLAVPRPPQAFITCSTQASPGFYHLPRPPQAFITCPGLPRLLSLAVYTQAGFISLAVYTQASPGFYHLQYIPRPALYHLPRLPQAFITCSKVWGGLHGYEARNRQLRPEYGLAPGQ